MEQKKYVIYQNDLKFRNNRNLDETKIDWNQNNIKHLYNINHDTLEYRIKESDENKNNEIDLRELKLINIPNELKTTKFMNISHLFLSNNNLSEFIDISIFKNLLSVDLDNNNIKKIKLPTELKECSINNNALLSLELNKNLIRLRASNNKLEDIILSDNLEIVELDNNRIKNINIDNLKSLEKLIIFSNPLDNINITDSLNYIDISETNITQLNLSDNIISVVANSCKNLKEITKSKSLQNLELINSPVDKLYYYDNFELIILQLNTTKNVSKKYKENNANIQIRQKILLVISRGIEINEI
jgi:hypothetical protein